MALRIPEGVCPPHETWLRMPVISQPLLRLRRTKTTEQLTFSDGCETLIKSNLLSPVWKGLPQEKKKKKPEGEEVDQ